MNILNINYDSETKSFSIDNGSTRYKYLIGIIHLLSKSATSRNGRTPANEYIVYNVDVESEWGNDYADKSDLAEDVNHQLTCEFKIKRFKGTNNQSEYKNLIIEFNNEVKLLNDKLKRKGTFIKYE